MLKALDSFVRSFYHEIKNQNYTTYEFLLTKAHYKMHVLKSYGSFLTDYVSYWCRSIISER